MNSIQELFDNFDKNIAGRGLSLWARVIVERFYSTA